MKIAGSSKINGNCPSKMKVYEDIESKVTVEFTKTHNEVHCKMCNSGLDMQVLKGKSRLAITFVLKCFACPYRVEFSSSNFHEGTQIATINTRFVYAMRSIGKGAEAGKCSVA
ncbi:DUF5641 domain-containing protein [Trichonephila clavipes]|nr:DUF5641 domain-containing protein [Trichonephila clavipes]